METPSIPLRALALVVLLAALMLLFHGLPRTDIRGGDEARHAIMARNVATSPSGFINPSEIPAGPPGRTPFLYPLLLSLFLRLPLSPELALRLPSALAVLLAALLLSRVTADADGLSRLTAFGVFALSPWAVLAGRAAVPDACAALCVVAAFGAAAVFAAGTFGGAALVTSGALFGASFLLRPWLCAPALVGALVLAVPAPRRSRRGRPVRRAAAFLGGFIPIAGLQLLLASLFSPSTFRHWLHSALIPWEPGTTWLGDPTPIAGLVIAAGLPLVLLGALDLSRRAAQPAALGILAWCALGWLPEALGVRGTGLVTVAPAWALLAAAGTGALVRWSREELWRPPILSRAVLALLAAEFVGTWVPGLDPLTHRLGGPTAVRACAAGWAVLLAVVGGRFPSPFLKRAATGAALCAVLVPMALAGARWLETGEPRNYFRDVDAALHTELTSTALDATAFIAPDPSPLMFYSARRGRTWQGPGGPMDTVALARIADGRHAQAYIVTGSPGSQPGADAPAAAWLERHQRELTAVIENRVAGRLAYRVFVAEPMQPSRVGPERPPGVADRKSPVRPERPPHRYRRL